MISAFTRITLVASLAVCLLAAAPGCRKGPRTVPVSGIVTLDGKPVPNAGVLFAPQEHGPPASGETDAEGKFTLTTGKDLQGAPPGLYNVSVTAVRYGGVGVGEDNLETSSNPVGVKQEWIVPQKFSDPKNSGIQVEVKAAMEPVKIDLKTP